MCLLLPPEGRSNRLIAYAKSSVLRHAYSGSPSSQSRWINLTSGTSMPAAAASVIIACSFAGRSAKTGSGSFTIQSPTSP